MIECQHCGTLNLSSDAFCKACGTPLYGYYQIPGAKYPLQQQDSYETSQELSFKKPVKESFKKLLTARTCLKEIFCKAKDTALEINPKILIGVAAGIIVLSAVIASLTYHTQEMDLRNYTSVNFEGINGYGTAKIDFDWDALKRDYPCLSTKETPLEASSKETPSGSKKDSSKKISAVASKSTGLSNGEKITIEYSCDQNLLQGKHLKESSYSVEVSGLRSIREVDLFNSLDVSFEGVSGDSNIKIKYTGKEKIPATEFICSKVSGLKQGESVTIQLKKSEQEFASVYGFIPACTTKTYIVTSVS